MQNLNKIFFKLYLLLQYIFGFRYNKWCLALLDNKNLKKKIIFSPPKNEFWADPFYFRFQRKDYCFFERYNYLTKKGEISCAEIKENKLINFKKVLRKKYHLSFPNVFRYKKNIYLVPETHENKRLEVYICKKFPDRWSLYSSAFNGEIVCDPIFFFKNKKLWLFINKTKKKLSDLNKNLYIYQLDSLKLRSIIPHKKNPVISKLNGGRNAAQQMSNGNKLLRISQNCKNLYGESVIISEIKKLTLSDYKEEKISEVKPSLFEDKNIIGIHSWSKYKNKYLVDILFKFKK